MYHTVVIGGGCLGAATAISLQHKLNKLNIKEKVCIIDKSVLCAAESSRHSGIVRSANADQDASLMASESTKLWKNLESIWGVDMETEQFGAIWIAKKGQDGENKAWKKLSKRMKSLNIEFNEIDHSKASELCGESLIINEDESYYY